MKEPRPIEKGAYCLVARVARPARVRVGRLGRFRFPAGWYAYMGSAMGGIEARVARHLRADKKLHWHMEADAWEQ